MRTSAVYLGLTTLLLVVDSAPVADVTDVVLRGPRRRRCVLLALALYELFFAPIDAGIPPADTLPPVDPGITIPVDPTIPVVLPDTSAATPVRLQVASFDGGAAPGLQRETPLYSGVDPGSQWANPTPPPYIPAVTKAKKPACLGRLVMVAGRCVLPFQAGRSEAQKRALKELKALRERRKGA